MYNNNNMVDTPETLKSRLYRLETYNEEDIWVEKCQGYPIFKKEDVRIL